MKFRDSELNMLSDGLLALIHNACEAKEKVAGDEASVRVIDEYIKRLSGLNNKICDICGEE